jgi:hypothetical protein
LEALIDEGPRVRPKFTVWPWGVSTVLLSAIALAPALWLESRLQLDLFRVLSIYLALLAFVTAILFALATNEFARHWLAVPFAGIAGAGALFALNWLPIRVAFLVCITIAFFRWLIEVAGAPTTSELSGFGKARLMTTLMFGWAALSVCAFDTYGLALLTYPFMASVVTGMFPGEISLAGTSRAFDHGLRHAFGALCVGLFIVTAFLGLAELITALLRVPWQKQPVWIWYAGAISTIPIHCVFVRRIFRLISEVELGL